MAFVNNNKKVLAQTLNAHFSRSSFEPPSMLQILELGCGKVYNTNVVIDCLRVNSSLDTTINYVGIDKDVDSVYSSRRRDESHFRDSDYGYRMLHKKTSTKFVCDDAQRMDSIFFEPFDIIFNFHPNIHESLDEWKIIYAKSKSLLKVNGVLFISTYALSEKKLVDMLLSDLEYDLSGNFDTINPHSFHSPNIQVNDAYRLFQYLTIAKKCDLRVK